MRETRQAIRQSQLLAAQARQQMGRYARARQSNSWQYDEHLRAIHKTIQHLQRSTEVLRHSKRVCGLIGIVED